MYDNVKKPYHYNWLRKEVIDIIRDCLTEEEFSGFLKGNVIKYSLRAGIKDYSKLKEDLDKRNVYLEWLLEHSKKEHEHPEDCMCPECRYRY